MTPRTRAAVFALPLIAAVVLMGLGLPRVTPSPALPIQPGTYVLGNLGTYTLGFQYANDTSLSGPRGTVVTRPDFWVEFTSTVNSSRNYRIRGTWTADAATMVVVAWNIIWSSQSSVSYLNHGCGGWPGQFCPSAIVVMATSGSLDFVLGESNPLCTNPPDRIGPCQNLGDGTVQGYFVGNPLTPAATPAVTLLSVVFLSFDRASVTVVAPITLEAA